GDSKPRISLLGEGGGLGLFRGKLNFAHRFRNFTYNFGVSHTNFDKGIDGDDAARNTSGQGRFSFALNENLSLSARFYASDAFVQLNSNPDTIGTLPATGIIDARPLSRDELRRRDRGQTITNIGDATFIPDVNDPDASQASRFFNFHTALDGIINKDATYRFSYQNLTTSRKNFNGPGGIGFQPFGGTSRSDFDGNIQTFQAKTNLTIRSNTVTIGYGFEREKIGNDNFFTDFMTPINATDAAQSSNTFIIQDQLEAFEKRLQLSGAFRAQFFNLGTPRFSSSNAPYQNLSLENPPNAYTFDGSAAYFFRSIGTKLRAHVGNGYRVPSLYERFGTFFATFVVPNRFVPLGAPDLEPERSLSVDGGIDQTFASNRVRLSATYFYTRLINTIDFGTLEQPDRFGRSNSLSGGGYLNREGGISRGAEFSAEFKPTLSTDIFTSYTFTNSDQRRAQVSGSGIIQTLGVPDHQFSFVATQRLGKRLTLNFDFVSTSSYLAPIFSNTSFRTRLYRFNGQRKGDLTAAYEIPTNSDKLRFRLFGTIENLFNQDYYENGFRTARATGRGGLQVNF
ncbi:MAG TPA: hypothetical protein VEX64_07745, partial [Pyrinomonadaceae bacterium]|nr:hypothetical protein [Pyrinomonadaceae bacterium]